MAGIYLHIPFCKSRCIYCGFFSTTSLQQRHDYVDAVVEELRQRRSFLADQPIDTIYFDGNQYTGTNQNRYDYLEYYSIDSLASGKYFFFVEDGCDYHLPRVWQEVREVQEPKITAVSWYAWSGSYADSNVIRVQMTVNMPNAYYTNPEYVQYRFIHEDINGITDTTFRKWLKQYEEGGLDGLCRADAQIGSVLPDGVDQTEEALRREIIKLRIENERLKKNYTVETNERGEQVYVRLSPKNTK